MKVIMTGGGTGGHIYPAIAIADRIKAKNKDAQILFVGTKKGLENTLVPKNGYDIKFITVRGFYRKNLLKNIETLKDLAKGEKEAKQIIEEFKPDIVIGTGGYVSGPVVRAAHKAGIKTYIHEQNAFAGVTNKILSRYVDKVFISFEEVKEYFKDQEKLIFSGNPVRKAFYDANPVESRAKLGYEDSDFVVLAFGGSQGAGKINEMILALLDRINGRSGIKLIFVTGKYYYEEVNKKIAEMGIDICDNIQILKYIDDMPIYLSAADVVISRAGALTVSEITVCAKASILIPSPNVTGNHQYFNAKSVADKGGAILIEEKDLNMPLLYEKLMLLKEDEDMRKAMEEASLSVAPKDAAEMIAEIVTKQV